MSTHNSQRSAGKPFQTGSARRRRSKVKRKIEDPAAANENFAAVFNAVTIISKVACNGGTEEEDVIQQTMTNFLARRKVDDLGAALQQSNYGNDSHVKAEHTVRKAVARSLEKMRRPHRLRKKIEDPANPGQLKKVRRSPRMTQLDQSSEFIEARRTSKTVADAVADAHLVGEFLDSLNGHKKDVARLMVIEGLSEAKIADRLKLNPYDVHKIRAALREHLVRLLEPITRY